MTDPIFTQSKAVRELTRSFSDLRGEAKGFAADLSFDLGASTEAIKKADAQTRSLTRTMGTGLRRALDSAVFGGGKLSDIMKGLAVDLGRATLNSALAPVQNSLASGLSQAVTGGLGGLLGFANGGAFSSGKVRAFAEGGVVRQATAFPMRGGAGLMGEAGPEAIMPLTRGADGKLGVKAESGGAPNVTVNIQVKDADSFRRSQSQVAAAIARAVERGRRNQ